MVKRQTDHGPAGDEDPVPVSEGMVRATGAAAGIGPGALLGPAGLVVVGLAGAVGGGGAGPGVRGRRFTDIEPGLRRGWLEGQARGGRHDDPIRTWDDARPFISCGYGEPPR